MKLTYLLIVATIILSCKTKVEMPDDFDPHKELYKSTFSEVVDSVVKMGVPRSQIILPDSFLSVRVHAANSGWVLNENTEVLDEYICHVDYPDFKKKVIDELPKARVSEETTKEFHTFLMHMNDAEGKPFILSQNFKYKLFMYVIGAKEYGGEPFSFYLNELQDVQSDSVAVYYIFPKNYKEFGISTFEFQKRRVSILMQDGVDYPDEILDAYGLQPKG